MAGNFSAANYLYWMKYLVLAIALAAAGCTPPPPGTRAPVVANDDPGLKPPVTITSLYGNQFTCQAGPGSVCVQR
jgi:hypothetical protein